MERAQLSNDNILTRIEYEETSTMFPVLSATANIKETKTLKHLENWVVDT